jgi:hypothetical protein
MTTAMFAKNEKTISEPLDQAILALIVSPKLAQQTTAIGTLFWKTR